mmetsp:Transcript_12025/g.27833  ORF Transcript_12025/g.27833 Transcript_12025/m.27833 type:complete len:96 (-) Transcript_12025:351-638(-)
MKHVSFAMHIFVEIAMTAMRRHLYSLVPVIIAMNLVAINVPYPMARVVPFVVLIATDNDNDDDNDRMKQKQRHKNLRQLLFSTPETSLGQHYLHF